MKTVTDPFEAAALIYIRLVRRESHEAAAAVEKIQATFGARAALRAALILTILKTEVEQNQWIPGIGLYFDLLADYPDALSLTKLAMRCCLRNWVIPGTDPSAWTELAA
ncbi:MAG: hypothetical protein ABI700_20835 [Chloroflexota bacterium]